MKIVRLEAENFRRLRAVDITPDPEANIITISGKNAEGKSSVLDSIWAAMAGSEASKRNPKPIRDGEHAASVRVTLDNYIVTREWRDGGPTAGVLKVTTADGIKVGTAQSVLDGLRSKLTFDPLAFSKLSDAEQRATLLSLIDLSYDPVALEDHRAQLYEARTIVGRELDQYKARLAALTPPQPHLPATEVSAAVVIANMQIARAAHEARSQAAREVDDAMRARDAADQMVTNIERQLTIARDAAATAHDDLLAKMHAHGAIPEPPDLDGFATELSQLEDTNSAVRAANAYSVLTANVEALTLQRANLTEELDGIEQTKRDAMKTAKMPLPDLGFTDNGITYNDIPFIQASAAERLKVSTAIGCALNPTLRVMTIQDASLLDQDSMQIIADVAKDNDFQVWIEVVAENGEGVGITIEDGSVIASCSSVASIENEQHWG